MPSKKVSHPQWKEVKLSGNLITDDSVGTLEGLVGLEVLEDYDGRLVTTTKPSKKKKQKQDKRKSTETHTNGHNDSEDESLPPPTKKSKKEGKKKEVTEESEPGQFVRAPNVVSDEEVDAEEEEVVDLPEWQQFGLHELLLKALKENGFTKPTQIQSLTLPAAVMGRRDILGAAETGSGKTLAFGLPILNGILELKKNLDDNPNYKLRKGVTVTKSNKDRDNLTPPPEELDDEDDDIAGPGRGDEPLFAVIVTPTRELAVQVRDHIKSVARYTGIQVAALFGGMAIVKQKRILRSCPEIVVATPGRLWELLKEGDPHLSKIDDIHFLVIDETDRMVEKGHFEELKLLVERLNMNVTKKGHRQNFIFSATLTLVHDIPDHLKVKNANRRKKYKSVGVDEKLKQFIDGLGISQPKVVDITKDQGTAESLTECRIVCPIVDKDYYLYYFLQKHPGRTIVFCNSIDCVRRLANLFSLLGCHPLPLHANMIQKQRLKNLERFRDMADSLLVATDVAARGLDIPKVDHVIHYQVPRTSENYVHRSGRTARANTEGITVLLMEPGELKYYNKMCKTLNRSEDLPIFPVSFRHLMAVKERVNLAREVDVMDLRARKESSEISWLEKAAEEMDIILSESEDDERHDGNGSRKHRMDATLKLIKMKKNHLSKMLQTPLFPGGFSYKYPTATGKLLVPVMGIKDGTNNAVNVMKNAIQKDQLMKGALLKDYKNKKRQRAGKHTREKNTAAAKAAAKKEDENAAASIKKPNDKIVSNNNNNTAKSPNKPKNGNIKKNRFNKNASRK